MCRLTLGFLALCRGEGEPRGSLTEIWSVAGAGARAKPNLRKSKFIKGSEVPAGLTPLGAVPPGVLKRELCFL